MRYSFVVAAALLGAGPAMAHPKQAAAPARPAEAVDPATADTTAIRSLLASYVSAIERLDASGTERLFAPDSQVFETGGSEGSYSTYLSHHLQPELAEFKSFKFSDYKVDVRMLGPTTALATESYRYRIETKKGEVADRVGVATSVLSKENGQWKIVMMHNSGRRPSAQ